MARTPVTRSSRQEEAEQGQAQSQAGRKPKRRLKRRSNTSGINKVAGEEGGPSNGRLCVGRWWLARRLVLAESRPSAQRGGTRRLSCHPHRIGRTSAPRKP